MQQRPWYLSTAVIIIAFLIFWPAGIVLLLLRAKGSGMDRQAVFKGAANQKLYMIGGAVLIILGIVNLFNEKARIWGVFMVIGGGVLIYFSTKIAKTAARNRDYIDMIVNQDIDDINVMSQACGVSVDTVEKELSQLIAIGVLKNTSIDYNSHTIAFSRPAGGVAAAGAASQGSAPTAGGEMVTVACPGCGAKLSVRKGTHCTCDYCDAPISV